MSFPVTAGIALAFVIFTVNNVGSESDTDTFLSPQQVVDFNKRTNLNELILTPTGSAFANTKPDIRDGFLTYLVVLIHIIDDYIGNALLFNLPSDLLNTPGINKIGVVKLLQDIIAFANSTDYTFANDGLENNAIACLRALHL